MGCASEIAAAITNDCDTIQVPGLEKIAYVCNRADHTITFDGTNGNLVTAIANASTKQAYKVTMVKKEGNLGSDLQQADNLPDMFSHYLALQPYDRSSDNMLQMDTMEDFFIVAELKGEKTEGCFIIIGLETGLYKRGASYRVNDNSGLPTYEFGSMDGQGEKYSRYIFWDTDYDTTKAAFDALETPGV